MQKIYHSKCVPSLWPVSEGMCSLKVFMNLINNVVELSQSSHPYRTYGKIRDFQTPITLGKPDNGISLKRAIGLRIFYTPFPG